MASSQHQPSIRITEATESQLSAARSLLSVAHHSSDTARIFVALEADRVIAATSVEYRGGVLATCTVPALVIDAPVNTLVWLIREVIGRLPEDVKLVTMLGTEIGAAQLAALKSAGFAHAGDVRFYLCHRHRFPETLDSPLQLSCAASSKRELASVMHRTCEDTLDLPILLSSWSAEQMVNHLERLPGYRPELWFTATFEGRAVGTLLLEVDGEESRLVYLGLIPECRGRGWGHVLLAHAMQIASRERASHMMLSVDTKNAPAIRVYEQAGFVAYTTQSLYFRRLSASQKRR